MKINSKIKSLLLISRYKNENQLLSRNNSSAKLVRMYDTNMNIISLFNKLNMNFSI